MNSHLRLGLLVALISMGLGIGSSLFQSVQAIGQIVTLSDTPDAASLKTEMPLHPLLGNANVRKALAYCTDRPALIASVFSFLDEEARDALLMDTFLPKTHWAYDAPSPAFQYPFNPTMGRQLLEDAGWTLANGATYRRNAEDYELTIKLTTTDAQFRETWAGVLESQWRTNCGIRLLRSHVPSQVWFGRGEGSLVRRDFELGALSWVGQTSLAGQSLYGCDFIPTAENQWFGQNSMGWCNPTADTALSRAYNTLERDALLAEYAIVQEEFAKDMVSLPLFLRAKSYGVAKELQNYQPDSTEYDTWNAHAWSLPGQSTLVIALDQEPANLRFGTSAALGRLEWLIYENDYSQRTYDFQPVLLTELPTLESGLAKNLDVDVVQGTPILDADGKFAALEPGVRIQRADGQIVTYDGGTVRMKQMTVEYPFQPNLRWSDGQPLRQADFELARMVDCNPASQNLPFCDAFSQVVFSDSGYTITYVPGSQNNLYYLPPFMFYPSHQIIQSVGPHQGKMLAEVPVDAWYSLPEVVEIPLGTGPYRVVEWQHGVQLVLEPNPFYWRGTETVKFEQVIVRFDLDYDESIAALEAGDVHVVESVFASTSPQVEIYFVESPTWEHLDMNLNLYTQAVTRVLPVSGGEVRSDVGITLSVPSGVLPTSATVIVNDISLPSESLQGVGASVRAFTIDIFDAAQQTLTEFAQPLVLTIEYTDEQLGGVNEETLNVVYWNSEKWVKLLPCEGCNVDKAANRITVQLDHLSEFALTGRHLLFAPSLHD